MISFTFSEKRCYDPLAARNSLESLGLPVPMELARCNGISIPLGESSSRGWLLLLRRDLDTLDLNALHTLKINDDLGSEYTLYRLVINKEPLCLTYNMADDPNAIYLVEISDTRWLCHNPYWSASINKQFNVRAPGWGGSYFDNSRNSGSDWTWSTLCQNIWETMSCLGAFPGLPGSPHGTPEGFVFPGVSAWKALNHVLYGLGYAVAADLTLPDAQYSIVEVGAANAATSATLAQAEARYRKIFDGGYLDVVRGRIPRGVRVFFHRQDVTGTEAISAKSSSAWQTAAVYSVDVDGPDTTNTESVYHPVWDDLPALYDTSGTLTNSAALALRAAEVADKWFDQIRGDGGGRLHQIFSGLIDVRPCSILKGVSWRQDHQGAVVTEVVRHPFRMLDVDQRGGWVDRHDDNSSKEHPPDFRTTWPYAHTGQIIQIENGTPSGSLYDSSVQKLTAAPSTWADQESVYAIDLAGASSLTAGNRYQGRLVGYSSRPVYAIRSGGGTTSPLTTKGDIWVYSTTDTRLPVGTNGYYLVADSAETTGLKWVAASSTITTDTVDGSPSYSSIGTLRFDEADGFVLTNPAAGVTRIDIAAATTSQAGIVSLSAQTMGDGTKTFRPTADATVPLVARQASVTQSANLQEWQLHDGTVYARVTEDSEFSNPGSSSTTGEQFGDGAVTKNSGVAIGRNAVITGTAADCVAIGYQANIDGFGTSKCIVIGSGATTASVSNTEGSVVIGYQATSGHTGAVVIGREAESDGSADAVVIGYTAYLAGTQNVGIGASSSTEGSSSVVIGYDASSGTSAQQAVVIGHTATGTATGSIAIGGGAAATHPESAAIGRDSLTTDDNQFVIGGYFNEIYLGRGVQRTTLEYSSTGTRINSTGAADADGAGEPLKLAGGISRGTGVGGNVVLQIAPASVSSGSTPNTLIDGLTVTAAKSVTVGTGFNLAVNGGSDVGATATTGGMSFARGLYVSGSLSVTLAGDVTGAYGSNTISDDAVTNAKLAEAAAYSFKANLTNGSANPTDAIYTDFTALTTPDSGDMLLGFDGATGEPVVIDLDDMPTGATSPLTTKGDLWTYSTVDARLPVGSDGRVLVADSGETSGLKWVAGGTLGLGSNFRADPGGSVSTWILNVDLRIESVINAIISGNQNNFSPTGLADAIEIWLIPDADLDITGLQGGISGRVIILRNTDATYIITLKDQDTNSSAANRFDFGADVTIQPKRCVIVKYDDNADRWYLLAGG